MEPLLESLTDQQAAELVHRLYKRGGEVRLAVLEEARKVLQDIDAHQIADDVFFGLDIIDVETLWDQSGPGRHGYVSPDDQALDMIEDEIEPYIQQLRNYKQLDMEAEAIACLQGILLGLYRFAHESQSEFKDWAVDIPQELFAIIQNKWVKRFDNPSHKEKINEFCREMCPNWTNLLY
jgi:hypothetical protein